MVKLRPRHGQRSENAEIKAYNLSQPTKPPQIHYTAYYKQYLSISEHYDHLKSLTMRWSFGYGVQTCAEPIQAT